jgi:hypothetical protein
MVPEAVCEGPAGLNHLISASPFHERAEGLILQATAPLAIGSAV